MQLCEVSVCRLLVNPYYASFSAGSRQAFTSDKIFGLKIEESGMRDIPCFRGGLRRGRCTKFEVNQTNLKRVILPVASSASSGDLRPDVSGRQVDVRPDVTTKTSNCPALGMCDTEYDRRVYKPISNEFGESIANSA